MLKKISLFLWVLVFGLSGLIYFNTVRFSKPAAARMALKIPPLPDSAISHLQQAIRIPTIGFGDHQPVDTARYLEFWKMIEKNYPLVHQQLSHQPFNGLARLYKWEGKHPEQKPWVFMAHYDVVPVEPGTEQLWTVPTFKGEVSNGMIYGRGVADDKASLISILEATESLLSKHFKPERTIYLSFGNDEETTGLGAQAVAKYMEENGIHPETVLDEGGEITKENFPDLRRPVALIAVAEKGYMSFKLSVEQEGGHSSTPAAATAIDILNEGLYHLRKQEMPYRFLPLISEMLNRVGPYMPMMQRVAIANEWLFEKLIVRSFEKDKNSNALFHTTIVPTIFQTGIKDNVIPTHAEAVVNTRILPGTSTMEVEAFMHKAMNDDRIRITRISQDEKPNHYSASYESVGYKKVEEATYAVMQDVLPVPFLSVGATDSKYFEGIADAVIKYVPSLDSKGFHGIDERLKITDVQRMVFFYQLMMQSVGH